MDAETPDTVPSGPDTLSSEAELKPPPADAPPSEGVLRPHTGEAGPEKSDAPTSMPAAIDPPRPSSPATNPGAERASGVEVPPRATTAAITPPTPSIQSWPVRVKETLPDATLVPTLPTWSLPLPRPPVLEQPSYRARAIALLAVLCAFLVGLWGLTPPAVVEATAPDNQFSAARASQKLGPFSGEPRAPGTPGHAKAQEALLEALKSMGVEAEVQQEFSAAQFDHTVVVSPVHNVIATLPGSSSQDVILLSAHYDSTALSPGAADNGSGAVTVLETLRALKAGPPLERTVMALFADGEELGLLGARTFARWHKRFQDVRMVMNFDARGTHGASLLFETSPGALELVDRFARVSARPTGSALAASLYRLLPNNTEFTVLSRTGNQGLNFAFAEGLSAYHSPMDSVKLLDLRSVQHHGEHALAVTRALGSGPLPQEGGDEPTYFNLSPYILVRYPSAWAFPLSVGTGALLLLALAIGLDRRHVSVSGMLGTMARLGLLMGLLGLGASVAWHFVLRYSGEASMFYAQGDTWRSAPFVLTFALLGGGLHCLLDGFLSPRTRLADRLMGTLWALVPLLALLTLRLESAAYILVWPLLLSVLALLGYFWMTPARSLEAAVLGPDGLEDALPPPVDTCTPALFTALSVAVVGWVLMASPVLKILLNTVGLQMPWAMTGLFGLLLGILIPWLRALFLPMDRLPAVLAGALGLAGLAWLLHAPAFDPQSPEPSSLLLLQDADSDSARWISLDAAPNTWTSRLLGASPSRDDVEELVPTLRSEVLAAPAKSHPVSLPRVERIDDETIGGSRTLRLKLAPGEGARWMMVAFEPELKLLHARITDARLPAPFEISPRPEKPLWLELWAPPREGMTLEIEVPPAALVRMRVVQRLESPPELPPLPPGLMLRPHALNGSTLVTRTVSF